MILGAIDIGTNTVRLLIAEKDGGWQDIAREMEITRLGEGVNSSKQIKPEAMERTLEVLGRYAGQMREHGVERRRAVATSAMRDATNAGDFIELVQGRLGFTIEVIPGEEEGRLTFAGATGQDSLVGAEETSLVVDVGGGSTEFIWGKEGQVLGAKSIDIGSVRLTEFFVEHDPAQPDELEQIKRAINEATADVLKSVAEARPAVMVAVAGTATQLAALRYEVEPYDPQKIHGSRISAADLGDLIAALSALPLAERQRVKGMHPQRADVIVAGAIILAETMRTLGFAEMVISEKDILDGIAYSIAQQA